MMQNLHRMLLFMLFLVFFTSLLNLLLQDFFNRGQNKKHGALGVSFKYTKNSSINYIKKTCFNI